MRRLLIAVLAFVLVCATAACSADDTAPSVVGTWALSNMADEEGEILSAQDMMDALGDSLTYEFKEDGTLVNSFLGISMEGTWTQDGDTVHIDIEDQQIGDATVDGTTVDAKLDGDTLTIESDGQTLVFERATEAQ